MIKKLATSFLDQCLKLKCFQDYVNGRITQNYLNQRFCVDDISQLSNIYSVQEYHTDDIKPDDVVLDIGANIGAFVLPIATKCKHVYAFEPLYDDILSHNIKLNGLKNIDVLPYGLGEHGHTEISYGNRTKTASMSSLSTIMKWCRYTPTFLKIDCEGAEWTIKPEDLTGIRRIEGELHFDTEHRYSEIIRLFKDYEYTLDNHGNTVIIHATRKGGENNGQN